MIGLFIFRRDIRLHDNTGLNKALEECQKVYIVFMIDPRQADPKKNPYFSNNAFNFMLECLQDANIPIIDYKDLPAVITKYKITKIYANSDYTPFARLRDDELQNKYNLDLSHDYYLTTPGSIKPYKVFTPYYLTAKNTPVKKPSTGDLSKIVRVAYKSKPASYYYTGINAQFRQRGSLNEATTLLRSIPKKYQTLRDYPSIKGTSRLSPYIKFGVVSIRQVYYASTNETFRKELYWRDFYAQITWYFPHIFKTNFRPYKIKWRNDPALIKAWKQGKTGIPLVDAGINELLLSGYVHNRVRMVLANVLTKLFKVDWRIGEQFFAQHLTDYDPSSNNGGWQWASGTGADAQPFYRIFNPYTQAEKFDPECVYIKKWLPQYSDLTPKEIFALRSQIFDYEAERGKSLV